VNVGIFLILVTLILAPPGARSTRAHGTITVDAGTTDWCAPDFLGTYPADTRISLTPNEGCTHGNEVLWEDGAGDTRGFAVEGTLDPEVDLDYWATTADATYVYFLIGLGPYAGAGTPPHVQIAIAANLDYAGNQNWYDPLGSGTGASGREVTIFPDYLITTDVLTGTATLWEATSTAGTWTSSMIVPLAWSGPTGIIEVALPWAAFSAGPSFGPGSTAYVTLMTAHSAPADGLSDAPGTAEDDVMSEERSGLSTTTDDCCACGYGASACECADGSADAFTWVIYQSPTAVGTHSFKGCTPARLPASLPVGCLLVGAIIWLRRHQRR